MTPKETLQRFIDFVNSSKIDQVSTFVFYGYEIDELQKFLKKHNRLQEFKATFDKYELSKKQDFIAYENWQECEKELEKLKRDVKRYFELLELMDFDWENFTEHGFNELNAIETKLMKVGKGE